MKNPLLLIVTLIILFTTNLYAATLTKNEQDICDNATIKNCMEWCSLKRSDKFIELKHRALSIKCAEDYAHYSQNQ